MNQTKIIIVDDHGLFREGLVSMFSSVENFSIVASVGSGEEAINAANKFKPDVIVMDIMLPNMSGIEATKWIKDQWPDVKVLLLSMEVNLDLIEKGISVGALGYMLKTAERDELIAAVQNTAKGEKHFSDEIQKLIFDRFYQKSLKSQKDISQTKEQVLTKRELEIIKLVAKGTSNKEIADQLFISQKTVDAHVYNIQTKLHLKSKVDIVNYVHQENLLSSQ